MGQNNSKISPEDSKCLVCLDFLQDGDIFVDCKTCCIKIHSECLKYYVTHKLNYESCSDCIKYFNY